MSYLNTIYLNVFSWETTAQCKSKVKQTRSARAHPSIEHHFQEGDKVNWEFL